MLDMASVKKCKKSEIKLPTQPFSHPYIYEGRFLWTGDLRLPLKPGNPEEEQQPTGRFRLLPSRWSFPTDGTDQTDARDDGTLMT
jgi:hypothetical protein